MINYHHIGGRNGTYPLPLKKGALLQDFHLILYDADANCFEQMEKVKQDNWGKISVYPYCIGGKSEKATFNLNFHPTTNSLYPFNEEYAAYGFVNNPRYGEYVLGDAIKHIKSIDLDLLSLSDVLKIANVSAVDFLSLDVQGAEFDILQGAESLLKKNCIGIQLEVEFVKLYSGQKTFFDINVLLESMGFELIDIEGFGRCAPISLPIGYRGLEQVLSSEAIYVKKLDYLVNNGDVESICKGAFFNLIYKKLGLCLKFLTQAMAMGAEEKLQQDTAPQYQKLLWEIWNLYQKDKVYIFPSIGQLFSNEAFQNFYSQGTSVAPAKDAVLKKQISHLASYVDDLCKSEDSPLEMLLKKYELDDVAEMAKNTRLYETNIFLELAKNFS